jgi:pyruvate dehydrogenase E2 component (dihydrolipoamide acetyltransferase)
MPTKILMPALSPTMTEGNLARWLKKEGDTVASGDVLAEIETDKATMEVEAADEGVLGKIVVPEGTEGVKVNSVIGLLLEEGEDRAALDEVNTGNGGAPARPEAKPAPAPAPQPQPTPAKPPQSSPPAAAGTVATPLAQRIAGQAGIDLATLSGSGAHGKVTRADVEAAIAGSGRAPAAAAPSPPQGERIFASPLARRLAADKGLDLAALHGSGPEGRIVRADVEAALGTPTRPAAPAQAAAGPAAPAAPAASASEASEVVSMSMMRKVVAERMTASKTTVPHFYLTVDCEIDELLRVRKALNARDDKLKLSVNDFVIRACALALLEVPQANVSFEGPGKMRRWHTADISVAVALDEGLITPIVHGAEKKGLAQISAEMKALAEKARAGKLKPEEYQGGSFSISNLGMFGIKQFDAVINPPQACILAVGAGEPRAVVKDGQLAVATVMSCTMSVDHRVVDGATGARLLVAIKRFIEYPPAMLL